MQTNCVRKTGAVFFGGREIIRGYLTRAKSTRSIIEACCIIKTKTRSIIFNNAACFRFNAACFNNAACRFSTCKISPDNFPATKMTAPVFLTQLVYIIFLSPFFKDV